MLIYLQNDDDWVSVEEEKKDYSGLKIGTLKIEDKERALKSSSCVYTLVWPWMPTN